MSGEEEVQELQNQIHELQAKLDEHARVSEAENIRLSKIIEDKDELLKQQSESFEEHKSEIETAMRDSVRDYRNELSKIREENLTLNTSFTVRPRVKEPKTYNPSGWVHVVVQTV